MIQIAVIGRSGSGDLVPGALIKGPKFKAPCPNTALLYTWGALSLTIIAVGRHSNFWEAAAFPTGSVALNQRPK